MNSIHGTSGTDAATLLPRQETGCLVAEATPINEQIASKAIGQFCQLVGSMQIAGNSALSSTIEVDGLKVAMQISASDDEGYMLNDQTCIGGFEMLLTQCSDGASDPNTKGGTLVGDGATFSLVAKAPVILLTNDHRDTGPNALCFSCQAIQNHILSSQLRGFLTGHNGSIRSISAFPDHRSISLSLTNSVRLLSL